MRPRVVVFGEASRGDLHTPYRPRDLLELEALLGHPPGQSLGLYFAVQTMLFERDLIYFRVEEEGYSLCDYYAGLRLLVRTQPLRQGIAAVSLPGGGAEEILEAASPLTEGDRAMLIMSERDLYDYLTQHNAADPST